ncbi:D-alanyl-D-alanine carboxypeptidase [uncultured Microbacterium sp.]|uniref:D-alanyl-D-alanine carboxypeptidase family protein n=1 Tax=uncultured Microbacterium sp. TaxID=191216 RepID=UPI0025D1C831|nr:D-alanyl-D-alanine carboxypeptidase [uncultured Microbacterium sp.]
MTMPHDDGLEDFADLMASAPSGASHVSLSAEDAERLRRRRRRRRRGWLIAAGVVLAIVAGAGGYTAWALSAPLPALETTTRVPTVAPGAPAALAMPSGRAAAISVVGAAGDLGAAGLHAVSGDDQPRPIASISKLITALVVLDAHPLQSADDPGPTITFDKADHDLYDQYYVLGATVAAMPTGSSMSLRDALTTMLLPSASNYADAVAMWAFGSRSGYVSATRTWLQAHQLNGTTIVEPTGIDERNTSTPSDLLAIGQLAAANPALARITSMPSATVPTVGEVDNTNDLLGSDGVTGLKTGNLGAGTFALLYTATSNPGLGEPLKIVGVSLDGQSREQVDADVTTALRSVAAGVHLVPVAKAGTPVGTVTSPWGGEAQLVLSRDESLLTWSDTPITASITLTIAPTGQDGQQIGIATWTSGGRSASVAVAVRGTIAPPDDWWKLTHPSLLGGPAPSPAPSPSVSPSPTPTPGG